MKPIIFLLCGLPGSGKTTYAKELSEKEHLVRLTLDEELFKRFGKEFPSDKYSEYEIQTKQELLVILEQKIKQNESVILDYGFWKKEDRNRYKQLIENYGAEYKLIYLKQNHEVLIDRINKRNEFNSTDNHIISEELLEKFKSQFEEPKNENEIIINII